MDQEKIGRFIAECRKSKNLTQEELADKLGITGQAVSKWERGKSMPDLSLFKELSNILGITINELISGEHISSDNYQNVLEENIIKINVNTIKKYAKITTKGILVTFISISILIILIIVGISFYDKIATIKHYYKADDVNVKLCNYQNKFIYSSVELKDGKQIFLDVTRENEDIYIKGYRYLQMPKDIYQGFTIYRIDETENIYYENKLIWDKDMTLEMCNYDELENKISDNFKQVNNVSNLLSSNPYDYIDNEYYKNIVSLGKDAVPILEKMYKNRKLVGLNAYLSALAIEDITGCHLSTKYNWSSAEEFYNLWKTDNCEFEY